MDVIRENMARRVVELESQREQLREALEYAANHILGVTGCRPGSDSEEVYNAARAALKATEEG